jgi:hypothetical protein
MVSYLTGIKKMADNREPGTYLTGVDAKTMRMGPLFERSPARLNIDGTTDWLSYQVSPDKDVDPKGYAYIILATYTNGTLSNTASYLMSAYPNGTPITAGGLFTFGPIGQSAKLGYYTSFYWLVTITTAAVPTTEGQELAHLVDVGYAGYFGGIKWIEAEIPVEPPEEKQSGIYTFRVPYWQRITTNRFVNDSDLFWRPEFHPRFKDVFVKQDFATVISKANDTLSFKLSQTFLTHFNDYFYNRLAPYRISVIPDDTNYFKDSILADLYFIFQDVLPQMQYSNFPIVSDDFNVVQNSGFTAKKDNARVYTDENHGTKAEQTSKVNTAENHESDSENQTAADILTETVNSQAGEAGATNTDTETNKNTRQNTDTFLSPQDQGVDPRQDNERGLGVDGFFFAEDADYTTTTSSSLSGETDIGKINVSDTKQSQASSITQNNDARTAQRTATKMEESQGQESTSGSGQDSRMGQGTENTAEKTDEYRESLDFDRAKKLQEFFNLGATRMWLEIFNRMDGWILKLNIATTRNTYLGFKTYD